MGHVALVHPEGAPAPLGRMSTHDVDALRLIFKGSSVVDWYRVHFSSPEHVVAFLRVNEIDINDPSDARRVAAVRERATEYLQDHLRYRIPESVEAASILDLFSMAAGTGRRRDRMMACMTLKVMHILHYVDGHELLSMLPFSNREVSVLLQGKVERVVRGLLERGFPIHEFSGNAKAQTSILSKLLAKKDTQSAKLFDKLRFRFIVERREDIPPLVIALSRELVPFNYVVPNQSENTLIDLQHVLVRAGNLVAVRDTASKGGKPPELNETSRADEFTITARNEFSGPDFRVVNFIAEVPLRADAILSFDRRPRVHGLGPVVFGTVEFQIVDRTTAAENERGENRHSLYKKRQKVRVKERLERGKRGT